MIESNNRINITNNLKIFIYLYILAQVLLLIGVHWDMSWHITIGRDTFITPPHLLFLPTYITPLIIFFYCVINKDINTHKYSTQIFGLKAPVGIWLSVVSILLFLCGFFLDSLWHITFGIELIINSPPHYVMVLAGIGSTIGFLSFCYSIKNNYLDENNRFIDIISIFIVAVFIDTVYIMFSIFSINLMHNADYYYFYSLMIPALIGFTFSSPIRWTTVYIATTVTFIWLFFQSILPLFGATPAVGPIYTHVTHLISVKLECFLIPTAFCIDYLYLKTQNLKLFNSENNNLLFRIFIVTTGSFIVFVITQWYYSIWYLSPASEIGIFSPPRYPVFVDTSEPWWDKFWLKDIDENGNFSLPIFLRRLIFPYLLSLPAATLGVYLFKKITRIRR